MINFLIISVINLATGLVNLLPQLTPRLPEEIIDMSMSVFYGVGFFIPAPVRWILTAFIAIRIFIFSYNMLAISRDWVPIIF